MLFRALASLAIATLLTVAIPTHIASAQLFSPNWKGFGGMFQQSRPKRTPSQPVGRSMMLRWSPFSSSRSYQSSGEDGLSSSAGHYRTMCVRLCDGYYFPMSFRVTRGRMYRDARVCAENCDCETKLFYLPSSSGDMKYAKALDGQSYGRLDKAFAYRTRWDPSCSCKPPAWAASERMRHEQYALAEEEKKAELAARKSDVLTALIEREDAKEAASAAAANAHLAAKSGSKPAPAADLSPPQLGPGSAAPPAQQVATAEAQTAVNESGVNESAVDAAEGVDGNNPANIGDDTVTQQVRAEISERPPVRTKRTRAPRPSGAKSSRPKSRGFFQL